MWISRRQAVVLGGAALLGATTQPSKPQAQSPREFDTSDPAVNLTGLVKVMGDLSGAPVWKIAQGRIYALQEGEMPVPICGVHGLRYIKFTENGDAFTLNVRDWGFYTDYQTGEVLEVFQNPFTGEENTPNVLLTRYFGWRMGPDGQHLDNFTGEAWLIGRPLLLPWVFQGDHTTLTLELLVKYGHGGNGAEWVNFHTSTQALLDPSVTSAPVEFSWTGYSPWMRWMEMGDIPGRTLWNSNGVKTASLEQLDPDIRAVYDRAYPGSLDDPEGYEKTGGTTTTE